MGMKLKFKKNVTVDFNSQRTGEWGERTFNRNEEVDLTDQGDFSTQGNFADISFPNGDYAESVPVDSFEKVA